MTLLVLRPQPGADKTARLARDAGFDVRVYPLFAVASRDWIGPPPEAIDALLLTSANALRHGGPGVHRYRDLPTFVIGDATAAEARDAGFTQVMRGASFVGRLVLEIAAQGYRRLLHLGGANTIAYDPGSLQVARIAVYAAEKIGDSDALRALAEPGMTVLVHSPRAGRRLAALLPPPARHTLHLIAISPAALSDCGTGWASLQAAPTPDDQAMLALAARLCK
ncbi:MAG: uroporphyrinogen-III synthase [Sphingobium sp.]